LKDEARDAFQSQIKNQKSQIDFDSEIELKWLV